ncbi:MAG: hypothetical protein ACAI35_14760 [Candidatus Methylacidiphilales bacterium]|nr:hypothetical protein [Candidatus Methylacidiphilales bacterium]
MTESLSGRQLLFTMYRSRPSLLILLILTLVLVAASGVGPLSVARADVTPPPPPAPAPATVPAAPAEQHLAAAAQPPETSAPAPAPPEELKPMNLLLAWLGCSTLSFIVTWLLTQSGKAAPLTYSGSASDSPSASTSASSAKAGKKAKGRLQLTWRTFVLPFVWLPLPCMFAVTALGNVSPLVFNKDKSRNYSDIVGFSQKRNDPGWNMATNDMVELSSSVSVGASYAAIGFISLNVCLLLLLSVQLFAPRDPADPLETEGESGAAEPTASDTPPSGSASAASSTSVSSVSSASTASPPQT